MSTLAFDSLEYTRMLEAGGFTRQQAESQADALRQVLERHAESGRDNVATKSDVNDLRLEIEKVRNEIEQAKYAMLKWYIGGWVAMAAILAKGFHWFGF